MKITNNKEQIINNKEQRTESESVTTHRLPTPDSRLPIPDSRFPSPRVVLFANINKKYSLEMKDEIQDNLEKRGIRVTPLCFEGRPAVPEKTDWDIAFSLGGDGTVLYTARTVAPWGIPIIPVNLGTIGFIAEVQKDQWTELFEKWLDGQARLSQRCMLELVVIRHGKQAASFNCLNDLVVSASGIAKLIKLKVQLQGSNLSGSGLSCTDINAPGLGVTDSSGSGLSGTDLGTYRCDGLIIATATGSTAYSMAAGGPILDPEMDAIILCPICPFSLSNRPLVLHARQTLIVTIEEEQRSGVLLTVDGQDTFALEPSDKILVSQAP